MLIIIIAVPAVYIPIVLMLLCMLCMSAAVQPRGPFPELVVVVENSQPRR